MDHIQSESIHSIILDVHVLKAERQNSPFLSVQLKLDKDLMLSPQFPLKLVLFCQPFEVWTTFEIKTRTIPIQKMFGIRATTVFSNFSIEC